VTHQHPAGIYAHPTDGRLFLPFTARLDPMERLLIINFERDPDTVYIGFEPQAFDDPDTGRGLLVIGWQRDGRVDVYHQPQLNLKREDYDIVGKGLSDFAVRSFEGGHFTIGERGADLDLAFEDKTGRMVSLRVHERNPKPRRPFGLLAPFPSGTENPPGLPLVVLHDFYFVRQAHTDIAIAIDGRSHQPDALPAPIDGTRMHFVRYSPDLFAVIWNENHDGPLPAAAVSSGEAVEAGDAVCEIRDNAGHPEISAMRVETGRHTVRFAFDPPFPDIAHLADDLRLAGDLLVDLGPALGHIAGVYRVQRAGSTVTIGIHPAGGWRPRISKPSLWFIYTVAPVFRRWPTTYQWQAAVDLSQPGAPHMTSRWTRLS